MTMTIGFENKKVVVKSWEGHTAVEITHSVVGQERTVLARLTTLTLYKSCMGGGLGCGSLTLPKNLRCVESEGGRRGS